MAGKAWAAVAMLAISGGMGARAQKKKVEQPTIRVTVSVMDAKGAPLPNADVVMKQESVTTGRMPKHPFQVELHSDEKGTAVVQGFDSGIVLVQVIAHGFQTYGQAFIMKNANETVQVKLKPPTSQVTIYH